MPYQIKKHNGKFSVVNIETHKIFSKGTTKKNAIKQERLLLGLEHGMLIRKASKKKI
jgi:phosphopantothenoylcysteine synthetase/decarboxylase